MVELKFMGQDFDLKKVTLLAGTGPVLELTGGELHNYTSPYESKVVPFDESYTRKIIVTRVNGKYAVLVGQHLVAAELACGKKVVCRMISGVALKRARIRDNRPPPVDPNARPANVSDLRDLKKHFARQA